MASELLPVRPKIYLEPDNIISKPPTEPAPTPELEKLCEIAASLADPVEPPVMEPYCTAIADVVMMDPVTCEIRVVRTKCLTDGSEVTVILGADLNPTGETTLATSFTPYVPNQGGETCEQAQITLFEVIGDGVATDVATLIAAAIAANSTEFVFDGKAPVAATADDLSNFTIVAKPCGAVDSTKTEVTVDYLTVNGAQLSNYNDTKAGGVDTAAAIVVPAGACALVSACLEQCITKAELAALPDAP